MENQSNPNPLAELITPMPGTLSGQEHRPSDEIINHAPDFLWPLKISWHWWLRVFIPGPQADCSIPPLPSPMARVH